VKIARSAACMCSYTNTRPVSAFLSISSPGELCKPC
jgi:hypothetical protein